MARAAVTKLLLLVFLTFIICLPELFRIYSVSKVNFHCFPHQPCEPECQERKGGNGQPKNSEDERKAISDPPSTPKHEQWEQICSQETTQKVQRDSRGGWFTCETDENMEELHSNISSTALVMLLELSVIFQLNDTETVNLTLYGHSKDSFLNLQPPEEEDADQAEAFYCCLPLIPTSNSANQSHCLLWLANQTVLTGTETERLPWKRADKGVWCSFRVTFLVLLCVVFLIVVTTVIGKIYVGKHLIKKPVVYHIDYQSPNQQLKETAYHFNRRTGLSPIPELESQEDIETLLDKNPHNCYTDFQKTLHHRYHPPTSSLAEEQAC